MISKTNVKRTDYGVLNRLKYTDDKDFVQWQSDRKYTAGLCLKMAAVLSKGDPHSRSNPEEALVTHLSLDLEPDFDQKVIKGNVVMDVERQNDGNKHEAVKDENWFQDVLFQA